LEGYCFGDFYTRDGLDDPQRELITFVFIATLGGCENQLRGHTQGNLSVGNTKEKLISAITVILPYIGFPRSLNALSIINEF
jgi:4-carboxymuconolactone decarboxylase